MTGNIAKRLNALGGDRSGATMVEFAVGVFLFLVFTSGLVEFTLAFWQWNAAAKALQVGARLASVSNPVSSDLSTMTGMEGGAAPGGKMPYFKRVCSGASQSCSDGGTYSAAAMSTIVRGRDGTCGTLGPDGYPGMCDIFSRITPANVRITYTHTGLGFAGRPGGPVPTITLELTGLTYSFVFLNALLRFPPITIPAMRTTITGEDLSTAAPS